MVCLFFCLSQLENVCKIKFGNKSVKVTELVNTEIYERNRWIKRLDTTEVRVSENIQNKAKRDIKYKRGEET